MDTKSQLQQLIKILKDWVSDQGNKRRLLDKSLDEIQSDLAKTTLTAARGIASSLKFMSWWHQTAGTYAVLSGEVTGWHDIGRAYREQFLSDEMFVQGYTQDPRKRRKKGANVLQHYAIRNLAYGLMFDDGQLCSWLGGDLSARVKEGSVLPYPNTPFREFISTLWQINCTRSLEGVDTDRGELGPYREVFATWTDQEALASVLEGLCDYHLEMSVDKGVDDDNCEQDFFCAPLAVAPIEIHALRTVRAKLDLAMLPVEHELMQTPLGSVPPDYSIPHDELLERVEAWKSEYLDSQRCTP